ncbi:hypothetical protein NDU88_008159 [Pleurodeles waltl]|uniref:Uncharacterized protein n=1 Tax=Pleurodeles waltl TaxID=8319 RepID=A0AAV7VUC5_PLEWA|nr:hypothetical protein NDU88_008159 [Pleurodeles waltl]
MFLECEVDAVVVGPVEFGGVAEGDVVACGEDRIERVAGDVEVEVSKEDVVRRGKGVGAHEVGNGVTEGGSWSWWSVDERSSEGGVGVRVDPEVKVFSCLEDVVRVDLEGGFVDDGYSSSDSVGAVSSGDLVAVRDGDGDVRGREVVPPGFDQEGYVWGGGVEQVPELDGVLLSGACVEENAVEVVGVGCCRLPCSVAGEVAGAAGEGAFGVLRCGLEAGCGGAGVEGEEFAGRVAKSGGAGGARTRGGGAGRSPGADGRRRACPWRASGAPAAWPCSASH